jgi:hypothetical protein
MRGATRDPVAHAGILMTAMESKERQPTTLELAARARVAGEQANLAAKRAASNLRRAAAALRAQGYGSAPRRGA